MSVYNGVDDASAFTILPKNGSYFLTLTEDSLVYDNYCVDRAFRPKVVTSSKAALAGFNRPDAKPGFTFAGTATVFCQPGWVCLELEWVKATYKSHMVVNPEP